jgi:Methyltransferase FkbM domain
MTFSVMSLPTLSTFVRDEVERHLREGVEVVDEIHTPVLTINEIVERHLSGRAPDFLSLDTEGMDAAVLTSINYRAHAPAVVCVENGRDSVVCDVLRAEGYRQYADTRINSIFARRDLWADIESCAIPRCWGQ